MIYAPDLTGRSNFDVTLAILNFDSNPAFDNVWFASARCRLLDTLKCFLLGIVKALEFAMFQLQGF